MAGKKKEPIELVLLKGKKHLTKAEIEERRAQEVKAPSSNIHAPAYFPDDLKDTFDRYAETLISIEIMSDLDVGALERYVMAEWEYRKYTMAMLKLKSIGERYLTYKSLQSTAFKEARAAAGDLGLTISARCKLVIPKSGEEKPKNKFGKFAK